MSAEISRAMSAQDSPDCLAGGGEMGRLMRAHDWSATPPGPVAGWPQSLKAAVSICLGSRYPIVIWWGRDALTQFYNDAYIPILGLNKHPGSLGQSARECWREIWHIIDPMLEGVFATGEATWSEDFLYVIARNLPREEGYFTFSYSPIRDDAGAVGGIFCAVTETTGRVVGERRLRTLRELSAKTMGARTVEQACQAATATLAQNLHDLPFALIYLLDGEGKVARLAGATGLEDGSPACPNSINVLSSNGQSACWPLDRVAATGRAELVEGLEARCGRLRCGVWPDPPQSAIIVPLMQSGQDRLAGLLVTGISPWRALDDDYRGFLEMLAGHVATAVANARAYEEERKRAEALAELDRAKAAFFSNVSHEFRTPLTLMLGPVEDLLADAAQPPTPRQQERLEVAHRNALRLQKLVNTLLDFSRIEAGRVRACYEPVDLAALTAGLASNFRSACEKAGLVLRVDCPPLPEPVYVDREMWEKIVLNFLSNAFKYTLHGEIEVTLRRVDGKAVLSVRDTGTGIPADQVPLLFERFHRVAGTRGRTQEGTGIGLALVKELAHLHGGEVGAHSEPGKGSVFTVAVPLGKSHLPADRIGAAGTLAPTALGAAPYVEEALRWLPNRAGERPAASADTTPDGFHPPVSASGQRPCILLADDNADMRGYIARLLAGRYDVEAVWDGVTALAAARRHRPDLVLADVMMPGLDGFGLLKALRADPGTADVPVLLLSARAGEEARVEGLQAGADDYLTKPFSARELLARVQAHLALARMRL
jgi:signal transduction histidine kinase/ActR/RegA family two-component response regulator